MKGQDNIIFLHEIKIFKFLVKIINRNKRIK